MTMSHPPQPEDIHAVRIAAGGARLVLGCDMVVAASPTALSRMENGVTRAVINSALTRRRRSSSTATSI